MAKRVLRRLRLGPLRSRVVIGLDLKGERGWKSKEALMSGKFACWRALSGKRLDAEPGRRRSPKGVSGGRGERSSQGI